HDEHRGDPGIRRERCGRGGEASRRVSADDQLGVARQENAPRRGERLARRGSQSDRSGGGNMSSWPGRSSSGYGSRQASPVLVARQELIMSVRMTSESCASVTVTGPANGAVTVIFLREALKR